MTPTLVADTVMWSRGQVFGLCPEGTQGLRLGFQPQVGQKKERRPEGAVEPKLWQKSFARRAIDHTYLPPVQGGTFF